jgi:hypothetical protein
MEASQQTPEAQLAARAATDFETSHAEPRRAQPFRRFRSIGGRSGADDGYVERLEAELALLREENARLRFERAQRPDAGSMVERLRALSAAQPPDEDHRDAAWHLVGEALVMREVLVDVCKEIGQTTITLQTRLSDLGLDLPDRIDLGAAPAPYTSLAPPHASTP